MSDSTDQAQTLESAAAPPSVFIHIAGDVNVDTGKRREIRAPSFGLAITEALLRGLPLTDGHQRSEKNQPPAGAPSIIVRDPAQPLKVMADGHQVDAREKVTDHVALIFPETGIWVHPNTLARDGGKAFENQPDTEAAAKALRVLDYDDWFLSPDTVYDRHVIDRRFHKPAADPNLYPNLLLTDTYWTSTVTPWSAASAFYVFLSFGYVDGDHRDYSGFGLACRRARQ